MTNTDEGLVEKLREVADTGYLPDGDGINMPTRMWLEHLIKKHQPSGDVVERVAKTIDAVVGDHIRAAIKDKTNEPDWKSLFLNAAKAAIAVMGDVRKDSAAHSTPVPVEVLETPSSTIIHHQAKDSHCPSVFASAQAERPVDDRLTLKVACIIDNYVEHYSKQNEVYCAKEVMEYLRPYIHPTDKDRAFLEKMKEFVSRVILFYCTSDSALYREASRTLSLIDAKLGRGE